MKSIIALLALISLNVFASDLSITSPTPGEVIRDKNGKLDIEGYIDFGNNPPSNSNRGKVTCGSRQAPVMPHDYSWKINNYNLDQEGLNTITCTFKNSTETSVKSVQVVWSKNNLKPEPAFSLTPATGRAPLAVTVDSSASRDLDGTIVSRNWSFGDGSTASGTVASHTFQNSGNYTIILTITDNEGATSTISKPLFVDVPSQKPVSVFSPNPGTGEVPLQVMFDASLSYDPDGGAIREYHIDYGDGNTDVSSLPYLSHVYQTEGSYQASLQVKDDENELSTPVTTTIQVFRANLPPVAKISTDVVNGFPPLLVQFSGSESYDEDGGITSYTWYFPNSVTKSGVQISHEFTTPGSYKVILVVKDDRNVTSQAEVTITVGEDTDAPIISVSPESGSLLRTAYPVITLNHTDSGSGVNLATVKAYLNNVDVTARLQKSPESSILTFTLEDPLPQGKHYIRFEAEDYSGNESSFLAEYDVDLGQIPTSFIVGSVMDSEGKPLEGVMVEDIYAPIVGRLSVATDADGKFKIPYNLPGTYRLSFSKIGYTPSVRTITPAVVNDTTMGEITMGQADPVITPITAASGGIAENSTNTIKVNFPPGVLPYDINVGISDYASDKVMPGPLPSFSAFTYAFHMSAPDIVWGNAAQVSLEMDNYLGFPSGSEIPLGIFDRNLGRWLDSGFNVPVGGNKKDDSMSFFIPNPAIGDINYPTVCNRDGTCPLPKLFPPTNPNQCNPFQNLIAGNSSFGPGGGGGNILDGDTTIAGCVINTNSGDLTLEHTLPGVISGGREYHLNLNYHTTAANPTFLANSLMKMPITNDRLSSKNTVIALGNYAVSFVVTNPPPKPETVYRHIFQAKTPDGKYYPTGAYHFYAENTIYYPDSEYATAAYFGAPPGTRTGVLSRVPLTFDVPFEDENLIVNRRNSPFGFGWGLAGLEALHEGKDGLVLWENGNQLASFYRPIPQLDNEPQALKTDKLAFSPEITNVFTINGLIYATDCKNNSVYRISHNNEVVLVAGNGSQGFSGDGGPATEASLNCPVYLAKAETGGFYIADRDNYRVRRVDVNGIIKTIAHYPKGKPTSVAEDKMRAVYFTTDSELMLISPRGGYFTYVSENKGIIKEKLSSPSQVIFDDKDFPIVLDKDGGRILLLTPQNGMANNLLSKDSTKNLTELSTVKPKAISFDPVLRQYYVLDASGKLLVWDGKGSKRFDELALAGDGLKSGKFGKSTTKIHSMTYSRDTGLVLITNQGLFKSKNIRSQNRSITNYSSGTPGFFDKLTKLADGTYEMTSFDKTKRVFDSSGKISAILTPHGQNTIFQYEGELISKITLPGGAYFEFLYDDRGYIQQINDQKGRTTTFHLDKNGWVERIVNPDGSEKNYPATGGLTEIDEDGKTTRYSTKDGRLVAENLPGERVRKITPLETVSIEGIYYEGVLYAPGPEEIQAEISNFSGDCINKIFSWNTERGNGFRDCLGRETRYISNDFGWRTERISPSNRRITMRIAGDKLAYLNNANGEQNFYYTPEFKLRQYLDGENHSYSIDYNDKVLPSEFKDPLNNSTWFEYNDFGNLISLTNAQSKSTLFNYDESQNLQSITDPLHNTVSFSRDEIGNIIGVTDPENRSTTLDYDDFNRVISILDPMQFVTSFTYTPGGKLKTLTNAKNQTTTYEYHPLYFKVERMTNPANQSELYTYDANEQIKTKTNYDGTVINFNYDRTGWYLGKSSQDRYVSYYRDGDGYIQDANSSDGNVTTGHDAKGRVYTEFATYSPGRTTISYNATGKPASLVYKIGSSTILSMDYVYDARQLPVRINANLGGLGVSWERYYDVLGRPQQDILSNGMKVNYGFDDAGRLTYLSNEVNSNRPIARFEYDYNPAGTIKQIIKSFTRADQTTTGRIQYNYGYDDLDRLVSASGEPNFSYDQLGNQLQRGGQYNVLNQLLEDSEFTYSYTENGELSVKTSKVSGERTEYTWDDWGKLVRTIVKASDGTVKSDIQNKYDGFERRISKTVGNQTTKYFYHGEDILAEYDGNNNLQALYLHGPGIDDPIAMVRDLNNDGTFSPNELFFYAKDHLGSVQSLVDNSGKVVQRYTYTAYGKTRIDKTSEDDRLIKNPYAYTAREWEQETGDYYNRMRFYNPNTGRFVSDDPLGLLGGTNLYTYTSSNPLLHKDPFGLTDQDVIDAILFVSQMYALNPASFSYGVPGNSNGVALPFENHILVNSKFSNPLTEDQKRQLLWMVKHEVQHLMEGTWATLTKPENEHSLLNEQTYNWANKNLQNFINFQNQRSSNFSSGGFCEAI